MKRLFLCCLLAGFLNGCLTMKDGETTLVDGIKTLPGIYCSNDHGPALKADWQNPDVVEETVKDRVYQAGLISLWHNKPVIIRITNDDEGVRSFRAPLFLQDVAILKAVYGGKSLETPCMEAFSLAPGTTAELYVVPVKKGSYEYHETALWPPILGEILTSAKVGQIYIH
jgi:hypothetical protein